MISTLFRHLQRFRRDHRGTAIVETALILPLMVPLSAGVFEFGNLIHDKLLMEAGLSDAARYGARCNSQMYTDNGLAAINCADIATNIAVFGKWNANPATDPPRITGWAKANVTVTIAAPASCRDAVDPTTGVIEYRSTTTKVCKVRVEGTFSYSGIGMLSLLGFGPITLNASHEERYIRF